MRANGGKRHTVGGDKLAARRNLVEPESGSRLGGGKKGEWGAEKARPDGGMADHEADSEHTSFRIPPAHPR